MARPRSSSVRILPTVVLVLAATPAFGQLAFDPPRTFAIDAETHDVGAGDFDRDGFLDLVVAVPHRGVYALSGDGTGNFADLRLYPFGNTPVHLVVGDFNEDGDPDVAAADVAAFVGPGALWMLLGDGAGGFGPAVPHGAGFGPVAIASADMTGDGHLDLLATAYVSGEVWVLLGDGTGSFPVARGFAAGPSPTAIATIDLDRDGFLDVVVANEGGGGISVLRGDGLGGLSGLVSYPTGPGPHDVAASDFDGDGWTDVAVGCLGTNVVTVLMNDGSGGLVSSADLVGVGTPWSVASADVDADAVPELIVAGSATIAILTGDGAGGFAAPLTFDSGPFAVAPLPFDLDDDGDLDIAVCNQTLPAVSVLLNATPRLSDCFRGNVNAAVGPVVDVLFLNGSAGDPMTRSVTMAVGGTLTVDILNAPSLERSPFVIFVYLGEASPATETEQPYDLGTACFPTPLNGSLETLTLANGMGHEDQLGTALIRRRPSPAPTRVLEKAIGRSAVVTLQGLVRDDAALSPVQVAITNALVLRIH